MEFYNDLYLKYRTEENGGYYPSKGDRILEDIKAGLLIVFALVSMVVMFIVFTHAWDYETGRDTGYISAVDKMAFSNDRKIYLRRRPLDAQGFTSAEKDETEYCTTADRTDVIEKAYEAMESGKRVTLIYDEPREFGWRALGHCNSAPITDIKIVED